MFRDMKKKTALFLAVLALVMSSFAGAAYATTIGDILSGLGWNLTDEEENEDGEYNSDDKDDESSGKEEDSSGTGQQADREQKNDGRDRDGEKDGSEEAEKVSEVRKSSDYEILDITEGEDYDTRDEVCAYLVQFHELPPNFMTKKEAREWGWEYGPLSKTVEGMSIGGDYFGNYDENLPVLKDRSYHECDIDTLNAESRGAKRIVFSDDWNIYYTEDHYETFTLLYGDDDYEREFED